jgi:hypothetical protein
LVNFVMPGLCPGHPRLWQLQDKKDVNGRDKPGHDAATDFRPRAVGLRVPETFCFQALARSSPRQP